MAHFRLKLDRIKRANMSRIAATRFRDVTVTREVRLSLPRPERWLSVSPPHLSYLAKYHCNYLIVRIGASYETLLSHSHRSSFFSHFQTLIPTISHSRLLLTQVRRFLLCKSCAYETNRTGWESGRHLTSERENWHFFRAGSSIMQGSAAGGRKGP